MSSFLFQNALNSRWPLAHLNVAAADQASEADTQHANACKNSASIQAGHWDSSRSSTRSFDISDKIWRNPCLSPNPYLARLSDSHASQTTLNVWPVLLSFMSLQCKTFASDKRPTRQQMSKRIATPSVRALEGSCQSQREQCIGVSSQISLC